MKKKRVTGRFSNIVMGTMMGVVGIFSVAFFVIFVTKFYHGNKRDAH